MVMCSAAFNVYSNGKLAIRARELTIVDTTIKEVSKMKHVCTCIHCGKKYSEGVVVKKYIGKGHEVMFDFCSETCADDFYIKRLREEGKVS